jgi:hypothetical protein
MANPREIQGLTPRAEKQAQRLGLNPNEVLGMVIQSAPFTGHECNRRFESFAFRIGDAAVHHIVRLDRDRRGEDLLLRIDHLMGQIQLSFCPQAWDPFHEEIDEVRMAIKAERRGE